MASLPEYDDSNTEIISFDKAISERYLSYALTTIMSRSLPDVRDGLKPVHRRLLYAMIKLRLDPKSGYKKCARVVGDVIGKYHPHGDVAIYDTLVRLAQEFSLRYPLIDGQGNFGSIDGDNAAAMRYTESKLTPISLLLMDELDQQTVDFKPTYDDSDEEPALMPSKFPNLLANGSEGIAVGMATTIPPHNLAELVHALIYLIDNSNEDVTNKDLLEFVKGPDLPTGGIINATKAHLEEVYSSGRGALKVRARWHQENLKNGQYQIIITEIPYQVTKTKIIEQIASLLKEKKIPLIDDVRDESAENIRLVIVPRTRAVEADIIMAALFNMTNLENRLNLNMNVLNSKSVPQVMSLKQILDEFLAHRREVVYKRTSYRLGKIADRLETLEAYKIVYLNIDEVINIIRQEDEPKQELMQKFSLNETQADSILNLKLRFLRKLEEQQIDTEYNNLLTEQKSLQKITSTPSILSAVVRKELAEIAEDYSQSTELGARRTSIIEEAAVSAALNINALVEKEPITVLCSNQGWIRTMKGHKLDLSKVKYKEGDGDRFTFECYTTDNITIIASDGKVFTLPASKIGGGKGAGEPVSLIVDIGSADIVSILCLKEECKVLISSVNGKGFVVSSSDLYAQTKTGKQIMNVSKEEKCLKAVRVVGDMVAVISSSRKLLVFNLDEVPNLKKGAGVILQKYQGAALSDIKTFNKEDGLTWQLGSKQRREDNIMLWQAKRGGVGKMPPSGFPRDNKFG